MLEQLPQPAGDPILALMQQVRADERPGKLDLTVGVYRDAEGRTPVMAAVRLAEARVLRDQNSKAYVGLLGDPGFCEGIRRLVLGDGIAGSQVTGSQVAATQITGAQVAATQTPGGSGALRVLADLVIAANPGATIWLSDPTWPNHLALFRGAGLRCKSYPYFDREKQSLHFEALLAGLAEAQAGDVVVLHGCCHNPTGCDLSPGQWQALAEVLSARGLIPLVDLAYAGLGQGLNEDTAGLRILADSLPEVLVAVSCSKNFGVYRDRVGAALVINRDPDLSRRTSDNLAAIGRKLYSMPPHHGAAVVHRVLEDPALRQLWSEELSGMRERLTSLRKGLAAALAGFNDDGSWAQIGSQNGMFSLLGLSDAEVSWLRDEKAIYLVPGGRINFAALREREIPALAEALSELRHRRAA
ncbi:amino acid aminotransferase [Pelagibius sp. Alg239-R121]|uniref:amino acid aminotransferase n=1 Tax=Pelagibius sp. Alg239-R121 TaxID=2993448 RepID=UPI0024A6935A|nr:amino acid aminotransferase [Pelagibius sp. Alg239-R121]